MEAELSMKQLFNVYIVYMKEVVNDLFILPEKPYNLNYLLSLTICHLYFDLEGSFHSFIL